MTDSIKELHDSNNVWTMIDDVDSLSVAHELGVEDAASEILSSLSKLRLAAYLSIAEALGEGQTDDILRQLAAEDQISDDKNNLKTFRKWSSYVNSLLDLGESPNIEDLLSFSTAGLLAKRQTDVRSTLASLEVRDLLTDLLAADEDEEWSERVKKNISLALLLLVRQEDHLDIEGAAQTIQNLANAQEKFEEEWLFSASHPRRNATLLLGLYHLAQAVIRAAEFLRSGSLEDSAGRLRTDFEPELRRLLIKAEEFLTLSADTETLFWLNEISVILWRLRTDSIWIQGRGISGRLDELLNSMATAAREKPIFSLLPSQQEALQKSLLDPTRIAIVLQMPTSAGKTLLAEFSIVQTFEAYKEETRVVYVVPTRALATQIRRTLAEDLRPLRIQVSAAGSAFEEDPYELKLLESTDGVIVSTPEKLDLLLRTHPDWFQKLRLIIVDEAHLLRDGERGVRLELLLANIRREHSHARLLLLTPFIQNGAQIASWLGGNRGLPIEVRWRPSKLLVGLANISGRKSNRKLTLELQEPDYFRGENNTKIIEVPTDVPHSDVSTTTKKVAFLTKVFSPVGSILALYSASPVEAEKAAGIVAGDRELLSQERQTPALRVAIALAKDEYGANSELAKCLIKGVAFHHSSISPMLRYLIEDQARSGIIDFIASTTTLAQGMNFPVATVLVHSIHKPYGKGNLTPSEFWNIAGRAGRVGLVDKGMVVFANSNHKPHLQEYLSTLNETVQSAFLQILADISIDETNLVESLKEQYRVHEELRPFIQFLAHSAATQSPHYSMEQLDELLQTSLANAQITRTIDAQKMRNVARSYLRILVNKPSSYLKTSDTTGLGSFSFDQLFARIGDDPVLRAGPGEILRNRQEGLFHLVDALRWLPELSLAIGFGSGPMNVEAVARVIEGWIEGKSIVDLAGEFPGEEVSDQIRNAARYTFSKISQTISWGAHAYMRGWNMYSSTSDILTPEERMLGAYIQYGVSTPEAAVASLLGIPRQLAEPFASVYRNRFGNLTPEESNQFKGYIENADGAEWSSVVSRSTFSDSVDPEDVRFVWRRMYGLVD